MRLDELSQVHELAKLAGRLRNLHRQQRIGGLGGGEQVRDRTDAADAGGDDRHLPKAPPLAELLEATELDHVEAGVLDRPGVVELDGDFGVALDAGDGIDDDALAHGITRRWPCPRTM